MRTTPLTHCLWIFFFSVLIFAVHAELTPEPETPEEARFIATIIDEDFKAVKVNLGLKKRVTPLIMQVFNVSKPAHRGTPYDISYNLESPTKGGSSKDVPMARFVFKERDGTLCNDHPCFGWTQYRSHVGVFGSIFSASTSTDSDGHQTVTWFRHRVDPEYDSSMRIKKEAIERVGDGFNDVFEKIPQSSWLTKWGEITKAVENWKEDLKKQGNAELAELNRGKGHNSGVNDHNQHGEPSAAPSSAEHRGHVVPPSPEHSKQANAIPDHNQQGKLSAPPSPEEHHVVPASPTFSEGSDIDLKHPIWNHPMLIAPIPGNQHDEHSAYSVSPPAKVHAKKTKNEVTQSPTRESKRIKPNERRRSRTRS